MKRHDQVTLGLLICTWCLFSFCLVPGFPLEITDSSCAMPAGLYCDVSISFEGWTPKCPGDTHCPCGISSLLWGWKGPARFSNWEAPAQWGSGDTWVLHVQAAEGDRPDPPGFENTSPNSSTVTKSEREVARVTTGATGKPSSDKNLQMHKGNKHDILLVFSFLISFYPRKKNPAWLMQHLCPQGAFCTDIHVLSMCLLLQLIPFPIRIAAGY